MRQAFIIMQIGNADLDIACKDAIVPALKSCALDPKRVDKHNEGRLLKSEIVEFIESSDIIVADLTNERPNCYLEVGYAMGLDKFQNLILTAREDHDSGNPNYKTGGPKIHFDLSGYDILFWNPRNLNKFKEELGKRVKRRLSILPSRVPTSISSWNQEWISKHQNLALPGLKRSSRPGFMEIRMTLRDIKLNIAQGELLRIAEQIQNPKSGWPLGVVLGNREEYRPRAKTDGIVAEVYIKDRGLYDYWAIARDGTFYLLKSLSEYIFKPGYLVPETRIVQITEALIYSIRLYSGFKVSSDSSLLIRIRHGGLKDLVLSNIPYDCKSEENEVYTEVETTLEKIESDLESLVERFTQPLFVVFDFLKIHRNVLNKTVNDHLTKRLIS